MNESVLKKLEEKLQEAASGRGRAGRLASLAGSESASFAFGMAVGRLYNSFYYQSKRVLGREPTDGEFEEFVIFVESKRSEIERLW